jgi:glycosyltransferase involved in cell wall biosynthesis
MRIVIIGPNTPIPPKGWGAVESLIWDYKITLEKLGHEVQIINIGDPMQILGMIDNFKPDFVHINYDDWVPLYPYIRYPCAITTHFAYIERPELMGPYKQRVFDVFGQIKPTVFGLSNGINKVYETDCGIHSDRLYLNPNGVMSDNFRVTDNPKFSDRSIFLAKVDYRKRQCFFQSIDSLWYAGNIVDHRFNQSKNYLGEWEKEYLYDNLTDYGNLVLLSDGEAHSLVIMEAFAAGLGVVVSQWATANLDLSKKFITVIPEDKVDDLEYVERAIIENREYSVKNRDEILEYSKQFDWTNVIENYFIPNVEQMIESKKNKVAICFIGTGKYLNYLPNYYKHIEKYFLPESEKTFLVFTDGELDEMPDNVIQYQQDHLEWPFITLKRFEIINQARQEIMKNDWFVFIDADALVTSDITEEEFFDPSKPFFGVHHPCHFLGMQPHGKFPGAFETNPKCRASIAEDADVSTYWQGCLWGGKVPYVFELIDELQNRTNDDLKDDIIAIWHDESHLNKFFVENKERVHTLPSSYAYPEDFADACDFEAKIVHLSKNNSNYHI